jgi:1-acyl-sn-glycerol-3-phosphate acyltransferase
MRLQRTGRAPAVSSLAPASFQRYGARLLGRHLNAVRLAREPRPDLQSLRQRPLLIYLNHASWWDPLVCLQLAGQLMPQRRHYAPMGIEDVRRFPLFGRLGFFAVDAGSAWGVRRLLDAAGDLFQQPNTVLWIAPAGGPGDPRQRPPQLPAGFGHLVSRLRHGVLLPLAVEYPFWGGRRPEALLRFGDELAVEDAGMRARDWTDLLAAQLETAQEALAAAAMERDPARFEVLGAGAGAAGGVHEVWRRLGSLLRRGRARPPHGKPAAGHAER